MSGTGHHRAHHDLVTRAAAGALTPVERGALAALLDSLLVAVELTDEEGPDAGWWPRVVEGYRTLAGAEATAPRTAGGADVRPIRAR